MYIAPQGTIQVFKDVPLTPQYEHTYYFASNSVRDAYFASKVTYTFNNQMYTRKDNNKCRVEMNAEALYDCSYLRFENSPFFGSETKWYYAFITKVEYINNNVTEITYEIDVIQTWLWRIHLGECYIERQHSESDNPGDNLVPEPFNITEYVVRDSRQFNDGALTYIVGLACVTFGDADSVIPASTFYSQAIFNGLYSGYKYVAFNDTSSLQSFINSLTLENGFVKGLMGTTDMWQIVCVFAMPHEFVSVNTGAQWHGGYILSTTAFQATYTGNAVNRPASLGDYYDNYTPVNKKLLTYPFTYVSMHAPGNHNEYKFEDFSVDRAVFSVTGTANPYPVLFIAPVDYMAASNYYDVGISCSGFPYLNVYQPSGLGTIGQNIGAIAKLAILGIATGGLAAGAGAVGMAAGAVAMSSFSGSQEASIVNPVAPMPITENKKDEDGEEKGEYYEVAHTTLPYPATSKGITGHGDADFVALMAKGVWQLEAACMSIKRYYAEIIDEYLSKYGYAMNRVATPNLRARANWTYVKTRDAIVRGYVPQEALVKISKILDNGITFWNSGRLIGNYGGGNFTNPILSSNVGAGQAGGMIVGG